MLQDTRCLLLFSWTLISRSSFHTTGISIPRFSKQKGTEDTSISTFPPILSSSPGKCANSKSRCGCWRGFDEIRASISSTLFRFARRHLFCSGNLFFFFVIRSRGRFNFPRQVRFSISVCKENYQQNLFLNLTRFKEWNGYSFVSRWSDISMNYKNDLSLYYN